MLYYLGVIININDMIKDYLEQTNYTPDYQNNHPDYGYKTDPNFGRQKDMDKIYDTMRLTDWESEAKYFNYYFKNGRENIGNTIKLKKEK